MRLKWIILVIFLLFCAAYAAAEEFRDVTSDDLKKMIDGKEEMVLVDARSEIDYKQGHIPTAINISPGKFSDIQKFLPQGRDKLLVFYCMSGKSG